MRRTYRIFTTVVAMGAMLPVGITTSHADTSAPALQQFNWFWHDQFQGSIGGSGIGQRLPGSASGTPEGYYGIGYTNGKSVGGALSEGGTADPADTPNKQAYFRWELSAVPAGSTINNFTFKLVLDPQRSTPQPQSPVTLVACAALNDWTEAAPPYGDPFSGKPTDNCEVTAEGKWDAASTTYTFEATEIAQGWFTSGLNLGLGVRQKPGMTTPFQFNGEAAKVAATIDYTAPAPVVPPVIEPTVAPTFPPLDPNTGVTPLPPVDNGGFAPLPQPEQPQPRPQPAPTVAQPRPQVPVAQGTPFRPDFAPSGAMWAGLVAMLGLLVVTSLILGDPVTADPRAARRSNGGLDRALRTRPDAPTGMRIRPRAV